jgi:hypothetical protein
MSVHSKNKGNRFELEIVQFLKDLGYTAKSARSESKNLDDLGCDIVDNSPFSIQCKHVERLSMPVHKLLADMKTNGLPRPIVMHKRNQKGITVTMDLEDFKELIIDVRALSEYVASQ